MALLKQSTSFRRWFFLKGYNSTSALSLGANISLQPDGLTGLTNVALQICKEGSGTLVNPSGGSTNLTEASGGWYYADLASGDADTLGMLKYLVTWNSGSNTEGDQDQVVVDLPGASVTSVTNAVTADATKISGSTQAADNLKNTYTAFETGTAQTNTSSSTTLRAGASSIDNYYKDQVIFILSGTGAGQTNRIMAYNGTTKEATVETAWATTPDSASTYLVLGRVG